MTSSKRNFVFLFFVVALGGVALASTVDWKKFDSSTHFTVMYPESWVRIGISTDRLDILSSKGRAEGVVIRRKQGEIIVLEAQQSAGQALKQVIGYYSSRGIVLSQRELHNKVSGKYSCQILTEVISKEPVIPPEDSQIRVPNVINSKFFCEANGRNMVVILRNFEGNKRQAEYQRIALRIAESIRVSQ